MVPLGGGFFSGELLSLSHCWSALLTLCDGGEEPLKQGRHDCPFLKLGEGLGKPGKAAELTPLFSDASKDGLNVFVACGFSSNGLTPLSVGILPGEQKVLVAGEAELSHTSFLSAGGLRVEDRSEPTDLLAELKDVQGRDTELLFEYPL